MENIQEKAAAYFIAAAPKALMAVGIFIACWVAGSLLHAMTMRMSKRSPSKREVFNLLGKTGQIFFLSVGLISALGTVGMNVSALVTSLGLTGFALGFALKDAISNVLAGVLLILYRPFRRGDYINVTGLEGEVVDIDMRYTTLDKENRRMIIPNANLFTNPIVITRQSADSALPVKPGKAA